VLATLPPTSPKYSILLVVHCGAAALALAALTVSTWFCHRLAIAEDPSADAALVAYFRSSPNWFGRILHVVPLAGILLVWSSQGAFSFSSGWLAAGMACYVIAAYLAEALVFAEERRLHAVVRGADPDGWRRRAERASWAAIGSGLLLLVAAAVMVAQPA